MPIQLNLLAEAQAAEESRRKDPVKRGVWVAVCAVALVLCWSSRLQFKIMGSKSELNSLVASWSSIEKNYTNAVDANRKFTDAHEKIALLNQLATNRFLWGNALNAFQQTVNKPDTANIQAIRIKGEQAYVLNEDAKTKKSTSTEKIVLLVEAIDSSANTGSEIDRYKASIANEPFFRANLQTSGVTLESQAAPTLDGVHPNPVVKFVLKCVFAEKVR